MHDQNLLLLSFGCSGTRMGLSGMGCSRDRSSFLAYWNYLMLPDFSLWAHTRTLIELIKCVEMLKILVFSAIAAISQCLRKKKKMKGHNFLVLLLFCRKLRIDWMINKTVLEKVMLCDILKVFIWSFSKHLKVKNDTCFSSVNRINVCQSTVSHF